jgi:hypothetical protein
MQLFLVLHIRYFCHQRKESIMNSHFQPRRSGRGNGTQSAVNGAMSYMSEEQTRAYLMARDTIRRIQRSSFVWGPTIKPSTEGTGTAVGRHLGH